MEGVSIADSEEEAAHLTRMRAQARALVGEASRVEPDLGTELDRLCVAASDELGMPAVALTLMTGESSHAVAGVSDGRAREFEEIQFSLGEGPARDAFATGRPVLVADLESAFVRWPGYSPAAVRAGVRAAYCFPVQLGAMRFGVLSFYDAKARSLGARELTQGLIFAEIATDLLLESPAADSADPTDSAARGLRQALHFRSEVYQAQGMLMVQLGVSLAEALVRMRAHAFAAGLGLDDLAVAILDGSVLLSRDGGQP